jgi:four helix bundle protein
MAHEVISRESSRDPLAKMRVYQLAREMKSDSWKDARALRGNPITAEIAGQLYFAVGSISANIGEAYSRSSGKDRALRFEYALGSVRESMEWYDSAEPVLTDAVVSNRVDRLEEMRRILLAIIPRERGRPMKR